MQSNYVAPEFKKEAFNCPFCNVHAQMYWNQLRRGDNGFSLFWAAWCTHCQEISVWHVQTDAPPGKMLYPASSLAPMPSPDLPEDCKVDYEEARTVLTHSPRAAAALLRLALQKLCKHLGAKGENINADIGWLVKEKRLSPSLQKAMDTIRVIGNEAVHPGELDLNDTPEIAGRLFNFINLVTNELITQPKEIDALFNALPEDKKTGIAKRDGQAS